MEIANAVEPVQDGRVFIELINGSFLSDHKGSPAEYGAGLKLAIERAGRRGSFRPGPLLTAKRLSELFDYLPQLAGVLLNHPLCLFLAPFGFGLRCRFLASVVVLAAHVLGN
jgi:hypothetical protein